MRILQHPDIPFAKGHYSTCIEHNGLLYISGQLPRDFQTDKMPEGIEAQTELTLKNIEKILEAAGSNLNQLLQVRIYIPDVAFWPQVNAVYASILKDHKPARCVVPSRELHGGALVEIEGIAFVD